MSNNKSLIWVPVEIAQEYEKKITDEEKIKYISTFVEKFKSSLVDDWKTSISALEEEAIIAEGLHIKVKQKFEALTKSCLESNYSIWENMDNERSALINKVNSVVSCLNPLKTALEEIKSIMTSINKYDVERLTDTIRAFTGLNEEGREAVSFLIKNFNSETAKR